VSTKPLEFDTVIELPEKSSAPTTGVLTINAETWQYVIVTVKRSKEDKKNPLHPSVTIKRRIQNAK